MPPTRIRAIILKRINFRETSVLVHLLTDSIGKIQGIMKGVRSPEKKVPPVAYQQGSCIECFVYLRFRGGIELVTEPEIIESFNFTGENAVFWRTLLTRIDKFIPFSRFNSSDIYNFLFQIGTIIPRVKNHKVVEILATERILFLLGFGPFLEKCLVCGAKENLFFFSGKLGGIICSKCQSSELSSFRLPAKHISALKFFSKLPVDQITMIKYIPEGLYKNLMKCLGEIIDYHMAD